MGLFGSCGSGKSFIINNIIEELKDNYSVFYIDVWKYVGHPLMRSVLFDIDTQLKTKKLGIYIKGYIDKNDNSLEKLLYADTDFEEEIDLKWNEILNKLKPIVGKLLWAAIIICVCSAMCHFCGNDWLKSLSIPIFSGKGLLGAMTDLQADTIIDGNRIFEEFKGAITEQYVLQQFKTIKDLPVFYWSNETSRAEIDFVIQIKSDVVPVEVKAERNLQAKSLKVYMEKLKPNYAIRTSMADYKKTDNLIDLPLYLLEVFKKGL